MRIATVRIAPADDDDQGLVARLSGLTGAELTERDRLQRPIGRWVARLADRPIGVATAFVRPDDRCFLVHRLSDEIAFGPLLDAALESIPQTLHLTIDQVHRERRAVAESRGFTVELTSISFDVPFADALTMTGRVTHPVRAAHSSRPTRSPPTRCSRSTPSSGGTSRAPTAGAATGTGSMPRWPRPSSIDRRISLRSAGTTASRSDSSGSGATRARRRSA